MKTRQPYVLVLGLFLAALLSCGGTSSKPGSSSSALAVTCTPASIPPGATSQCSATVQGKPASSSDITWATSAGTISSSGLLTAPSVTGPITVTATSNKSADVAGTAAVKVDFAIPTSKHVVMVMEENTSYSDVVGNTGAWPNYNNLIKSGALPTNYYADTHGSISDYFMLTTGQIVTTDDGSTTVWTVDNIARRMLAAGVSFKVYAEGITQGYLGGDIGLYVIRHNPFAMLSDVASNPQVANAVIWPFTQFTADAANNALPEFSFIIPNINDDAHTGPQPQADSWLQSQVVNVLTPLPAFQAGGDGILIVDFDEGDTTDVAHAGGHVSPVFWGPLVRAGFQQTSSTVYLHESMLLTVMDALGLTNPPGDAATAPSMGEFFVQK